MELLRLALRKGRLPNSLLFVGPDGSGKRRTALDVAKVLNCERNDGGSCGECGPCRAITRDFDPVRRADPVIHAGIEPGTKAKPGKPVIEGRFPDVVVIEPEKGNISINWIKFIREKAYYKPMAGRKRVFIIDHAEMMNQAASSALLKVYEEPPIDSCFILLTPDPSLLLPTIVSRCQTFSFSRPPREDVAESLRMTGCSDEEADRFAPVLELRLDRLGRFDPAVFRDTRNEAWPLFRSVVLGDGASAFLERFQSVTKTDVPGLSRFVEMFCFFGRDLLVLKLGADRAFLLNPDLAPEMERMVPMLTVQAITGIIRKADDMLTRLDGSYNKNLLVVGYFLGFGDEKNVRNNMRPI